MDLQFSFYKDGRRSIVTNSAAQHCSSLCLQSEGDEDCGEPIADFAAKHFNVLCGEAL
mgnify:CR=1 FL=1